MSESLSNSPFIAILIISLMFLLLLAGIVIAFVINNRQKQQQELDLTNTRLEYEKELRQVDHELREGLINRFSREIHDNLGQSMTMVRLALEHFKLGNPEKAADTVEISKSLNQASKEMRQLSRSLNSDFVSGLSLPEAIETELDRIQKLGQLEVKWKDRYHQPVLDENQKLMVYRIFQELLSNTVRHADARQIEVSLCAQPVFEFRFKDNGIGFDYKRVREENQISGLQNIERRAELAELACVVDSVPGKGSSFTIKEKEQQND